MGLFLFELQNILSYDSMIVQIILAFILVLGVTIPVVTPPGHILSASDVLAVYYNARSAEAD